jgi:hypothetical protein
MKTYIQTTFTLNITVLESGALQVEGFEPAFQSPEDLYSWLQNLAAEKPMPSPYRPTRFSSEWAREDELQRQARARELFKKRKESVQVWKDTAESPQPKEKLREMDLFREEYKRFKRKYPQASDEVLRKKAQQIVELRRGLVEEIGLELSEFKVPSPQAEPQAQVPSHESKVGIGAQEDRAEPSRFPGKPLQVQSPTPTPSLSIDQLLAEISQTKLR